jgi:hypothetical protein
VAVDKAIEAAHRLDRYKTPGKISTSGLGEEESGHHLRFLRRLSPFPNPVCRMGEITYRGAVRVPQAILSERGEPAPSALRALRPPLWLCAAILVFGHIAVPFLAGGMAPIISLACLVTLALITAKACHKRAGVSGVQGWTMLALALCIWAGGMVANALMHLSLGHYQGDASVCLMFFVIYGVPIIFATSSPENESLPVRIVDALLASALGLLFFAHIFSLSTLAGANPADAELLTRMFDIENGWSRCSR